VVITLEFAQYNSRMAWHDDPNHPLVGIAKKLERADENIFNLHGEIRIFFEGCKYRSVLAFWPAKLSTICDLVLTISYGISPAIPPNCFTKTRSEFPVFAKPLTKDTLPGYNRKIQGITKPSVLALIEQLQPYQRGPDAINDPLRIVHDMDRFDNIGNW
jgi:hypothetical protein